MKLGILMAAFAFATGLAACSSSSHHTPADGGDAQASPPEGGADADAAEAEASPPPFTGQHAYVITATFTPPLRGAPLPESHRFTLVLDGDEGRAMASALGGMGQATFTTSTTTDGTSFHLAGVLTFTFPLACSSSVDYDTMELTISADGRVTGSAKGRAAFAFTDVVKTGDVSAVIDGVPDTEAPVLTVQTGADPTDPFQTFMLESSEALLPDTMAFLTSSHGDRSGTLSGPGSVRTPLWFVSQTMLRFDETYVVDGAPLLDFAGNAATSVTFKTRAAPPLIAEDGFESAAGPTLGGALVISGAAYPVITGNKSLYVPPGEIASPTNFTTLLALRLHVEPGDKFLRFAYRQVDLTGADLHRTSFRAGVVGSNISVAEPFGTSTTPFVMPDGTPVQLGDVQTMDIQLPGPGDEVSLGFLKERVGSCGGPLPVGAAQGIIIDDVRVE